jgi:hypothetical protein
MEAVNGCVWMKVCVISSSRCCHMRGALLLLELHTSLLLFCQTSNLCFCHETKWSTKVEDNIDDIGNRRDCEFALLIAHH